MEELTVESNASSHHAPARGQEGGAAVRTCTWPDDEPAAALGWRSLHPSLSWLLRRAAQLDTEARADAALVDADCWMGHLSIHVGQACGWLQADCLPVGVAFELRAAALLPGAGSDRSAELLGRYVNGLHGLGTLASWSAARRALNRQAMHHAAAVAKGAAWPADPGAVGMLLPPLVQAAAEAGADLAIGMLAAGPAPQPVGAEHDLVEFAQSMAALAGCLRLANTMCLAAYEAGGSNVAVQRWCQQVLVRAEDQLSLWRERSRQSALRVASDLSSLVWLHEHWEPRFQRRHDQLSRRVNSTGSVA